MFKMTSYYLMRESIKGKQQIVDYSHDGTTLKQKIYSMRNTYKKDIITVLEFKESFTPLKKPDGTPN